MNRHLDPLADRNYHAAVAAENAREKRAVRRLSVLFWAVMIGFLVAGFVGLSLTPIQGGIG